MFDLATEARSLGAMPLDGGPPDAEGRPPMQVLAPFNQCMVGMIRFRGVTPWERHPDDEFLHVVEGQVTVTILIDGERRVSIARAGTACVVPADCWHRQEAPEGVALMYITSALGTDHSTDDTPAA